MTDTTPTPNELLTRIAEASRAGRVEELRSIVNELPVPPKPGPRLVLINLDQPGPIRTADMWPHVNKLEAKGQAFELGALLSRIDNSGIDVMTVIEQTVESFLDAESIIRAELVERIRTALDGSS